MNVYLTQELSLYQLALSQKIPLESLFLTPATLLSLVNSQINLLIDQKIAATVWVKLPPGNIWRSEIEGYQRYVSTSKVVYISHPKEELPREYFFIVLSPQFCSLILAHRSSTKDKTQKSPPLVTITSFTGGVIESIVNALKQSTTPRLSSSIAADFIIPLTPEPALINQLLIKQLQQKDKIHSQIITDVKIKINKQNQNLQRSLQLKDEYLTHVCQELRTPLTHMKTALSLLNSPTLKTVQRQRYLQMLNNQCDRQNSLIIGVLDLAQIERDLEATALESVRLEDVVPGVVSTYQPLAQEKGISLGYTVPNELPNVWCATGGLRQIAINLLSNSIKFTPKGGKVWVKGRPQGDCVQLEFGDTGIGIAETDIPKIFDRFYQIRPTNLENPTGAGLGLTIVQKLLSRSGATITVKSKPGEGSIFIVQLAIAKE